MRRCQICSGVITQGYTCAHCVDNELPPELTGIIKKRDRRESEDDNTVNDFERNQERLNE